MRKGMSSAGRCEGSVMGRRMTRDRREDLDPGRLDSCRRRADGSGDGGPDLERCICLETGKETRVFGEIPILPICVGAGVSSGEISDRLPLRPDLSPAATYILLLSILVPLSQSPPSRPPSAPRPTSPTPPPPSFSPASGGPLPSLPRHVYAHPPPSGARHPPPRPPPLTLTPPSLASTPPPSSSQRQRTCNPQCSRRTLEGSPDRVPGPFTLNAAGRCERRGQDEPASYFEPSERANMADDWCVAVWRRASANQTEESDHQVE